MKIYPTIVINKKMLDYARQKIPGTEVKRTISSNIDTLTGHLGEMVLAQYLFGDWRENFIGKNKGEADFPDLEVKTSSFPFSERLHLLVREDYALKRKPKYYVQVILNVKTSKASEILPGTLAILGGWTTSEKVLQSKKRDFGSKFGGLSGYRCYAIPIYKLKDMDILKQKYTEV